LLFGVLCLVFGVWCLVFVSPLPQPFPRKVKGVDYRSKYNINHKDLLQGKIEKERSH